MRPDPEMLGFVIIPQAPSEESVAPRPG
jgi:hypothetical protein